jgi:hypothetical protein
MDVDFNQADTLIYDSSTCKPKTRTVSHAQLTWNGSKKTFFVFNQQLTGWARMSGLGYMFNPFFLQDCFNGGWNAVAHTILPVICHKQSKYDDDHLYGALQVAFANTPNVRVLVLYYQQRINAAASISPASGLRLYNAIICRHGIESNIRSFIDTLLSELHSLSYDKRHGSKTFKEVAETYLDLYHRMAGHDPGQVYHNIPRHWQQINGLGKILIVDPEIGSWVYSQTKHAFAHQEYILDAFVQEVINYYDATTVAVVPLRASRPQAYVGQTEVQNTSIPIDPYDESLEVYNAAIGNTYQGPPRPSVFAPDAYKTLVDLGCTKDFLLARAKRQTDSRDPNRATPIPPKTGTGFNQQFRTPYTSPALVSPTTGNTGATTVPLAGTTPLPKPYKQTTGGTRSLGP